METKKQFMLKKLDRWKGNWNVLGLILILSVPVILIYSIITGDWNWKYWAVWGVLMLFQRFMNAAFNHAKKQIENEKV